jgi:hypothetical protein
MRYLIQNTLSLWLLIILSSCATNSEYTPFKLTKAEPTASENRYIKSMESMHFLNEELHKKVSSQENIIGNLKIEISQLKNKNHEVTGKSDALYKVVVKTREELHSCKNPEFAVTIRAINEKVKKEMDYDNMECSPIM